MKTVGIITFHRAINYGAMLQGIALQREIKSLGYESELIDYVDELYEHYKISYKMSNVFESFIKFILSRHIRLRNKRFNNFLYKNANISKVKYSKKNIESIKESDYLAFFTGSDQVFNPQIVNFDSNYLLSFVKDRSKCNSYAASIGLNKLDKREKEWLKNNIISYKNILIREKTGKELLKDIGIDNTFLVADPTVLISKKEWESMECSVKTPQKYILLYGFLKNEQMEDCVKKIAKEKKLPICVISDAIRYKDKSRIQLKGIGPAEWLYLIHHAEYVVTNSFHGMIFSFIYNKQVWIADSNDGTSSRMNDFLYAIDCGHRMLNSERILEIDDRIDYSQVNPRLEKYICRSKEILKGVLCDYNEK